MSGAAYGSFAVCQETCRARISWLHWLIFFLFKICNLNSLFSSELSQIRFFFAHACLGVPWVTSRFRQSSKLKNNSNIERKKYWQKRKKNSRRNRRIYHPGKSQTFITLWLSFQLSYLVELLLIKGSVGRKIKQVSSYSLLSRIIHDGFECFHYGCQCGRFIQPLSRSDT